MKKNALLIITTVLILAGLAACTKDKVPTAVLNQTIEADSVLYKGILTGGESGHSDRGDVSVERLATKKYVVFKNFKGSNGPDVRVYLTKTIATNAMPATDVIDLGLVKSISGSFNYELASTVDIKQYKYLVIWCAAFKIQFGYAEFK
jgi:hypothetical protein